MMSKADNSRESIINSKQRGGGQAQAVNSADAMETEIAIGRQAGFWKFVGILTLIGIVLVIVGIIAAIAIPAMMMGGIPATP